MKNLLLQVGDDFKPGKCFDADGNTPCPFAGMGCWSRTRERCPLVGASIAQPFHSEDVTPDKEWMFKGLPVYIYSVEKKP